MKFFNKKKAFGLFEILISLVIFGIGVISITSLNVRTYRVIKNNELADFADRTMIKSLEYFKSPTTNGVQALLESWMNDPLNASKVVHASIATTSFVDDNVLLQFVSRDYTNSLPIDDTCFIGPYKLNTTVGSIYEGFNICEQIYVEKKVNGYKITSRVVYKIDTESKVNQLIGYRPFTYEEN